ncbi:hypothetical protein HID58_056341 [Brassica napus]|uniref:Uncharacterized protein n=1 Tax=Brassica napus TaxID=3708 RepID=A0ABQ8AN05_BRANA|nr:hypothetical protein HID58_056341 [Brassica napus]
MAPLVAGPASVTRPPSDPPDSTLKIDLSSNAPDPPVPPDPPPDTLFTGFLWLYDLWATVTFPHKFSDPKLVCSCPFTAVCRCCPFTAVCRLPSTFALMAFAMIRYSLLLWQLGMKVLKLCILPENMVCLGSNCPRFSFKECFVLPHLSLVISEIVIGSIVLKMVLFEAEAKMFIVSRFDGVNCLTSLAMEVFIPPLYCFEQERQFEEVFLIDCPLSETTVVELVILHLSLNFYLSTCCLSFVICLFMAPCSHIVSFIDGVELF